ncbi:MAG: hypothetical protein M3471_07180, partial [Actinomycetota bacterium]|nr:hypothetical protein [Actinomycetota bacterium]
RSEFGRSEFGRSEFGRSEFGRSEFGRSEFGRSEFGRSGFGRSGFGGWWVDTSGLGRSGAVFGNGGGRGGDWGYRRRGRDRTRLARLLGRLFSPALLQGVHQQRLGVNLPNGRGEHGRHRLGTGDSLVLRRILGRGRRDRRAEHQEEHGEAGDRTLAHAGPTGSDQPVTTSVHGA